MPVNMRFPSAEEKEFCSQVNALLRDYGAKVSAFERENADHSTYYLMFECGSKRRTIHSDQPWHYDPPQEVVAQVLDWIHGARQAARWTTELPSDLES